jgi:hypothetical protein
MNYLLNILMPPAVPGVEGDVDREVRLPGGWEDDWDDHELEVEGVDDFEGGDDFEGDGGDVAREGDAKQGRQM